MQIDFENSFINNKKNHKLFLSFYNYLLYSQIKQISKNQALFAFIPWHSIITSNPY